MPRKYVLVLIVVTIFFFGGVYLLIRLISGGDDTGPSQTTSNVQKSNKLSADGKEVSYTVYGRVTAEEDRRAIRITVDDSERKLEVLGGYDESVVKSQTYSNKSSAFDTFLLAIENAGFTTRDTSVNVDDRALCSLGKRYVYQTEFDDGSTIRTWSTSCGEVNKKASFKGSRLTVDSLFKAQIPDYRDLVKEVRL